MNQALIDIQNATSRAIGIDEAKDATIGLQHDQIAALQQQIADLTPKSVTLSNIQKIMPESQPSDNALGLWYVARSQGAPKTGPHGTVSVTTGGITVVDFKPVNLGGQSDNVYCLVRKYPGLSDAEKAMMETAGKFSIGCPVILDPLTSVQAFEWDYQIRKSNGVRLNVGLQMLPDGTLRAYTPGANWTALGPKAKILSGVPVTIRVNATCDDKLVRFTEVMINDVATPVNFSHPVTPDKPGAPYLNVAYQLDGRPDAKPYKAWVGNLEATYG